MKPVVRIPQLVLAVKGISVAFSHGRTSGNRDIQQAAERIGSFSRCTLAAVAAMSFIVGIRPLISFFADDVYCVAFYSSTILAMIWLKSIVFCPKCRDKTKHFSNAFFFDVSFLLALKKMLIMMAGFMSKNLRWDRSHYAERTLYDVLESVSRIVATSDAGERPWLRFARGLGGLKRGSL